MIFVAAACSTLFLLFYGLAFQESTFYGTPSQKCGTPMESNMSGGSQGIRVPTITIAITLFGGFLFVAFTVLKYRSHTQSEQKLDLEKAEAKLRSTEHYDERFAKAAEMLGAENAATRLGGVYALAALGDEWSENRQQCVDLLCGYMRSPVPTNSTEKTPYVTAPKLAQRSLLSRPEIVAHPSKHDRASYRAERQRVGDEYDLHARSDEVEVRRAILASIARGTRRSLDDPRTWSNMSFDLSRCFIEALDFSNCIFQKKVDFNASIFHGNTNLREATFGANAQFDGCLFMGRTWLSKVTFQGNAWFRASEFLKEVRCGGTKFQSGTMFSFTNFSLVPYFNDNYLGLADADHEIPFATFDGMIIESESPSESEDGEGFISACPDTGDRLLWERFEWIDPSYTVICECGDEHAATELASQPQTLISPRH
ncbi:pentapeptide repeat-containing protein [Arthrobacter sp. R3-55]